MSSAADPITAQFSNIQTMLGNGSTPASTGGGSPSGPASPTTLSAPGAPQESGSSLVQFLTQLSGLGSGFAGGALNAGGSTLNSGLATAGAGTSLFSDPIQYYQALLSGNQQAMTQAIAPTSQAIASQYKGAEQSTSTSQPMGGYRSQQLANLPFQEAQQIGNLYAPLQANAASGLSGIANNIAGIGTATAGIGESEQGLGLESLLQTLQAQLTQRGQNIGPGSFGSQFDQISSGLANLI